jgi:serine/threonine-protein kinase
MISGRYRLEAPLGRGAMGEIWSAEHVRLKSHVAVKFLDPSIADDPEMLDRFLREAQSAAAVRSTHVVQIFDCGVEAGAPYISMELLQGESLDTRLGRCVWLAPEELNKIFGEVAIAIGNAHKMGVIHRDLKPGNIFLAREGELEITKVLDFGIAKVMSQSLSQTSGLGTRTGTLLGTPHYMSPEQARGSRDLDQSTDLWSLAIIAYECLTGHQPFSGSSLGDIVVRICTEEPRVPSSVADVPAGFDEWFLKGASKKPSDRFASAREMADALSVILVGQEAAASASRTLVLAGTGTLHSVPIPLTRREPAGSSAVPSSVVVASVEAGPHSSSVHSSVLSSEVGVDSREHTESPVGPVDSLGGTALLAARVRAGLARLWAATPMLGVLHGGAARAEWWRGRWSVALRWLTALRDALRRTPAYLGERWNARERWVLTVSLLGGAAALAFWYSANQRGSSLPRGERTAAAAPLREPAPERLETPPTTAAEQLPEAAEARASSELSRAPELSSRELVAGSDRIERRPAPSPTRERRRVQSSAAALRPGAAQARQTSEAEPARPALPSAPPSPRRSAKPNPADPFADRL